MFFGGWLARAVERSPSRPWTDLKPVKRYGLYRCLNGANLKKNKESTWNSRKFWTSFLILNRYLANFWSSFCFLAPYILHSWRATLECTPETIIYCSLIRKLYWWTQFTVTVQCPRLNVPPLTVLDSAFRSLDSEFQLLDFEFLIGGTRIPSGILDLWNGVDSKPRIPDSKAKNSRIMQSASPYMGRLKRYRTMTLPFFSAVSSSGSSDDKASPRSLWKLRENAYWRRGC